MGGCLRRNLEVWTTLIEPFFIKIDFHILPLGSTVIIPIMSLKNVVTLRGEQNPLDRKWNFRLRYCTFAPFPQRIPLKYFNIFVKGTLQVFGRLPPTEFFENWGRPRSPTLCLKILKKILWVGIDDMLKLTDFRFCS